MRRLMVMGARLTAVMVLLFSAFAVGARPAAASEPAEPTEVIATAEAVEATGPTDDTDTAEAVETTDATDAVDAPDAADAVDVGLGPADRETRGMLVSASVSNAPWASPESSVAEPAESSLEEPTLEEVATPTSEEPEPSAPASVGDPSAGDSDEPAAATTPEPEVSEPPAQQPSAPIPVLDTVAPTSAEPLVANDAAPRVEEAVEPGIGSKPIWSQSVEAALPAGSTARAVSASPPAVTVAGPENAAPAQLKACRAEAADLVSPETLESGTTLRAAPPGDFLTAPAAVSGGLAMAAPRVSIGVSVAMDFAKLSGGWAGPLVFNVWLRRQLRERRMSQRQLGAMSGVSHSTISRLLAGSRSPSLETATKLVHALHMNWTDEQVATYFDLLPEQTLFPTQRVESALRGDGSLEDHDVMEVMDHYLVLRAKRRKARATQSVPPEGPAAPARERESPSVRGRAPASVEEAARRS